MKTITHLSWPKRLLTLLGMLGICSATLAAPPRPPATMAGPTPPGNYVFRDDNQNNVFDAAESGIAGVRVCLFTSDGVLRETATTTSTGLFSFTSTIQPNTSYDVRIKPADAPASRKLVVSNQGGDDTADSDATMVGNTAVIVVQSDGSGVLPANLAFGYAAGDPDLVLTKVSDSFSVVKGATATFTISVSNVGGSTATGVVIRDTLDAGMGYVSSSPAGTTALLGSGQVQVTWSPGTLLAGANAGYAVTVRAVADGVLTNVAGVTATSADGTPRNNVASASFAVPVKLCQGESYVTSVSNGLTNVEWFRNGVTTGTGNSLTIVTAGTYSYTAATVGSDCQASSCSPVIIYDGSVANLTIAASQTAICVGESSVLTANNCVGTLTWSTNETTTSITVSPTVTTGYSFTCIPSAQDACPASASTIITVNPSVTATLSSNTICDGTTGTITATGGTSYTLSDGQTNTTGVFTVSPSATTGYSVTVTNGSGCTGTATSTVTVNPSVTATVASATICDGTSATLTANAAGGTGFTYDWSPAGTGSTQTVVVSPNTTTAYSVTVTNSNGCSVVATATVTVNPSVTATLSSATICNGTDATITATGGTSYRLSDGQNNTTGIFTVSPATTTAYNVTVTNGNGCVGTATGTVTVNPSVTATLSSATICDGTTGTITATGGSSYVLSDGQNNATGIFTVSPATTTTYTVTATSGDGCVGTATGTVTVNPSVTATVASATICDGTSATLTANAAGGTGFTYNWSPAGTGSTQAVTVSPTATTTYSVIVTNSNGCSAVATATVTVNPAITATIGVTPSQTICEGNSVVLTANATGGTSYSYAWSTSATSQSITEAPTTTSVYSVTTTETTTGCSVVTSTTITVNPTPALSVNNPVICLEATTMLSLTGCAGTVTWSTGTTGATLEVTPLQTTSYTAVCALSTGCSSEITATVTVTPTPSYARGDVVATRATCNGATANNDASIAVTGLQNTVRASISAADGTVTPDYANATVVTNNDITFANLPNPTQRVTYLIRLFSPDGTCSSTVTVTLDPAACVCPAPKCAPITVRKLN